MANWWFHQVLVRAAEFDRAFAPNAATDAMLLDPPTPGLEPLGIFQTGGDAEIVPPRFLSGIPDNGTQGWEEILASNLTTPL